MPLIPPRYKLEKPTGDNPLRDEELLENQVRVRARVRARVRVRARARVSVRVRVKAHGRQPTAGRRAIGKPG